MADMIKDAMAAADNHLKVAHDNLIKAQTWLDILGAGHNPVPGPLPKTQVFGLTGVWICLALFISLIVLAQFLRRRNFDVASGSLISKCQHKMENCHLSAFSNLSKISSIICKTSDAMQSSPILITHVDRTSARFLQWKTIALYSMLLVVPVSAVYHIMVTPIFGVTGVWTGLIIFMSLIGTAGLLRLPVFTGERKPSELNKTIQSNKAVDQQTSESADPNNQEITSARDVLQQSSDLMTLDPNQKETTSDEGMLQYPSELKQDPNNNVTTSVGTVPQPPPELIKPNVITKDDMTNEIKTSIEKLLSSKESLKLTKLDKINKNEVEDIRDAIKAVRSIEEYLTVLKSQKDNYGEHEKKIQDALKPAIDAAQSIEKIINSGI